jgi:hypothetical protein
MLPDVQVLGMRQIGSRQLLVNVSAALPVSADQAAAAVQQDLSAGMPAIRTPHTCGLLLTSIVKLARLRAHVRLAGEAVCM